MFHTCGCMDVNWKNQNPFRWPQSYENIADIFIKTPDTSGGPVKFRDLSNSCSICKRCKFFKIQQFVVRNVKRCRNDFFAHNDTLLVSDNDKTRAFDALRDLVKDPDVKQSTGIDVQDCLDELVKIEQGDLLTIAITEISEKVQKTSQDGDYTIASLRSLTESVASVHTSTEGSLKILMESMSEIKDETNQLREGLKHIGRFLACFIILCGLVLYFAPNVLMATSFWVPNSSKDIATSKEHGDDQIAKLSYSSVNINRTVFNDISSGCLSERHNAPLLSYLLMHRKKKFIGREWVIQILEKRVTYSRGVLMTAHFGFGKSNIAAQLICARENEIGWNLRKHVVAFHVCKYENDDTKNPLQLVKRLISFLSKKSEEYRQYISKQTDSIIADDVKCEAKILICFDIAIKNPLDILQVPDDEPWIVIIDALDECAYKNDGQNRILELLSDRLIHLQQQVPTWFKFIVTSRNMASLQRLDKLEAVHLASNSESNYNDIQQFILGFLNISFQDFPSVKGLVKVTEGNFLYITLALEYLKESGNLSQENIDTLPKKMEDIYELYFDRLFERNNDFIIAKSIFQLMSIEQFRKSDCLKFLESSNVTDATQFERIIEKLSSFVLSDFYLAFTHKSLYEWLISENNKRYKISVREGHVMISNYSLSLFSELSETGLYSIPHVNEIYVEGIFINLAYHASETDDKDIQKKVLLLDINVSKLLQALPRLVSSNVHPINMIKLLLNICQRKRFEKMYNTSIKRALEKSIAFGRLDVLTYLHENVMNVNGFFLLHQAASSCNEDIARYLIDVAKVSSTLMNNFGKRVNDIACSKGCISVLELMIKKDPAVLDMQCLWYATAYGHIKEISTMYLNKGDTLECIGKMQQMEKLKSLLLYRRRRRSAFVNFPTYSKHTFLHATTYEAYSTTYENKTLFSQEYVFHKTIGYKYEYSKLWSCSDIQGFTPGLLSVALNRLPLFSQVLDHVINKTCQSVSSGILYLYYYILHLRILNTHHTVSFKVYIWFICHELYTNLFCPRGASMEHLLMRHRRIKMIKLLVANGYTLDWDKTDLKGRTPLDYAKQDFIEGLEFHLGVSINVLSDKERLAKLCQCEWDFFVLLCLLCVGSCICALLTVFCVGYVVL